MLAMHNASREYYAWQFLQNRTAPPHTCAMAKSKSPKRAPIYFREWRKLRGLSQEQAAELTGLTQETISKIERRKIDWTESSVSALAHAYRCELADLFRAPNSTKNELTTFLMGLEHDQRKQSRALRLLKAGLSDDETEAA